MSLSKGTCGQVNLERTTGLCWGTSGLIQPTLDQRQWVSGQFLSIPLLAAIHFPAKTTPERHLLILPPEGRNIPSFHRWPLSSLLHTHMLLTALARRCFGRHSCILTDFNLLSLLLLGVAPFFQNNIFFRKQPQHSQFTPTSYLPSQYPFASAPCITCSTPRSPFSPLSFPTGSTNALEVGADLQDNILTAFPGGNKIILKACRDDLGCYGLHLY